MPRKDFYHEVVVNALIKDGWTITDDPLVLSYGGKDVTWEQNKPLALKKIVKGLRSKSKLFWVHPLSVNWK